MSVTRETATAAARDWCDAWNARDLDRVMAHYADDIALSSPLVVRRLGIGDGWIRGKPALRAYFARGMALPALRFDLVDVLMGVGSVAIVYRRETGNLVVDLAELDAAGLARRVIVCRGEPDV